MPAPALSVPVRANLDEFKRQMQETSSLASTAARKVAQQFLEMNKGFAATAGVAAFNTAGLAALKFAGKIALVVGAIKLMGDAVGAARDQLKQMVDIADKAASANFSPEFWQSWVNGAKGAEKQVEAFEGALHNAFQALKPILNPDWTVWDTGLTKVTAVEKAMREMRELFSTDQDSSGFTLFRNAQNQDQQTVAVLTYMKQLQAIGQDIAALDLGEKLFGASFVDKIRTGQTSIDHLLDDIKTKSADSFSNETVKRAKDLDEQLKNAWQTVSQNLHPSLEALDNLFLDFKSVWVSIVELMAKAAELSNKIRPASGGGPNSPVSARDLDEQTSLQTRLRDTGLTPSQRSGLEAQLRTVQGRIAQSEASQVPEAPTEFGFGGAAAVPLPKRRPGDAPQPPKATGGSGIDRFETSADQIEKRTAALQAEAGAFDLGTAAREKARIAAQLMTVAMQANAAAGKGENVVTEEQRKVIDEVSRAYGEAAVAMEKAKVAAQIKFEKDTAFLSQEDVAIAAQLRGIYPDVATALNSVEAAGLRAANGMRELGNIGRDINRDMFVQFGQNLRNGMSAWDAFKNAGVNALGKIADKLMSMAADNLWSAAFPSGSSGLGGLLGSIFGGGGAASAGAPMNLLPAIHHGGYGPGDSFATRSVNASYFTNAQRFHGGIGPGERAAIIRNDESVLTPGQMRALGNGSGAVTVNGGNTTININGNADDSDVEKMKTELARRDAEFNSRVVSAVQSAKQRRQLA